LKLAFSRSRRARQTGNGQRRLNCHCGDAISKTLCREIFVQGIPERDFLPIVFKVKNANLSNC
jgi:hypothetical protein